MTSSVITYFSLIKEEWKKPKLTTGMKLVCIPPTLPGVRNSLRQKVSGLNGLLTNIT